MNLSNVFSDGMRMVLQRAPAVPIVWGFASPGICVVCECGGVGVGMKRRFDEAR